MRWVGAGSVSLEGRYPVVEGEEVGEGVSAESEEGCKGEGGVVDVRVIGDHRVGLCGVGRAAIRQATTTVPVPRRTSRPTMRSFSDIDDGEVHRMDAGREGSVRGSSSDATVSRGRDAHDRHRDT